MKNLLMTSALVLSMAVSGAAFAHDANGGGPEGYDRPHHEMMHELSKLPAAKQQLFKDAMKKSQEDDKPLFEKIKTLHDEKTAILKADDFDKDAFIAKTKEIEDTQTEMRTNMATNMADVLAQLTPEERAIVAKAEPQHDWHHHHHNKGSSAKSSSKSGKSAAPAAKTDDTDK